MLINVDVTKPLFDAIEEKIENASNLLDEEIESVGDIGGYSVCINPHSFCVSLENEEFRSALLNSNYVLVDGIGYALYRTLKYRKLLKRQTGNSTIETLLGKLSGGAKVALVGGVDGTINSVKNYIETEFGNNVVYCLEPPFMDSIPTKFVRDLVVDIENSNANVILIGLGSPKQDILSRSLWENSKNKTLYIQGVGAFFDYASGRVPKPHSLISKLGLEWIYRLIFSFSRVWRRTFISMPLFFIYGLRNIYFRKGK